MLLQALAAGALTGVYFVKTQWKTLKTVFAGMKDRSKRAGR